MIIFEDFLDKDDLFFLRGIAAEVMAEEPFTVNIHPQHGDIRPQRVPSRNYKPGDNSEIDRWAKDGLQIVQRATRKDFIDMERYFLYYPEETLMHMHTDPAPADHWRMGIVLSPAIEGGLLRVKKDELFLDSGTAYFFNAGEVEHGVTPITSGSRIVLTVAYYH